MDQFIVKESLHGKSAILGAISLAKEFIEMKKMKNKSLMKLGKFIVNLGVIIKLYSLIRIIRLNQFQ